MHTASVGILCVQPQLPPGLPITNLPTANLHDGQYWYMADLLQLSSASQFSSPNHNWPRYVPPINMGALTTYLNRFPHQAFARYITEGLSIGFHIGYRGSRDNLRSLTSCPRLPYVLKGIHKSSPDCNTLHRLPLTPDHLRLIHATWSRSTISYDKSMLWAAFCIGFFCFQRSGEFTHTFLAGSENTTLSVSDVSIDSQSNPSILTIRLRKSKTNQFSKGADISLGRTGDILCPVSAMLSYMAIRPNKKGPLFIFQDGTPLSRQQLINHLRKALSQSGICPSGYSGHSFRIGAATTAAAIGMSDSTLKS